MSPTVDPESIQSSTQTPPIPKFIPHYESPCPSREIALQTWRSLCAGDNGEFHSVTGDGITFMSDVPSCCRKVKTEDKKEGGSDDNIANAEVGSEGERVFDDVKIGVPDLEAPEVTIGIDEAGRGPLLGPMTYSLAYWPTSLSKEMEAKGFDDSKNLTHEKRTKLWKNMEDCADVGYVLRVLHASEISRNMLKTSPYNLNAMSHDTAIDMIRRIMAAGVNVKTCYIDTVGIADNYKSKLDSVFYGKGLTFVVESKADSKYKVVSASSICAKVSRDSIIAKWKWSEKQYVAVGGLAFGSGYPSDPTCKTWLANNLSDPVFCYPDFVRFSWAPAKDSILKGGLEVKWEADDDLDDAINDDTQMIMGSFLGRGKEKGRRKRIGGGKVTRGFEYAEKMFE